MISNCHFVYTKHDHSYVFGDDRSVNSTADILNEGSIKICYIADKKLESDWAEIKNANSDEIKVLTSGIDSSPGWIRPASRQLSG